jgi:hypothetical protein
MSSKHCTRFLNAFESLCCHTDTHYKTSLILLTPLPEIVSTVWHLMHNSQAPGWETLFKSIVETALAFAVAVSIQRCAFYQVLRLFVSCDGRSEERLVLVLHKALAGLTLSLPN